MAASGNNKWNDAAVKDLTFAILMSTNNGGINVNANWDKVSETMGSWGYGFTKSAMSQHWTKKILKEFRERHDITGDNSNGGNSAAAGNTPRKPRTPKTPKTPASARGKKRAAHNDGEDDDDDNNTVSSVIRNKTPRASAKKVKYEEMGESDEDKKVDAITAWGDVQEDDTEGI